MARASSDNSGNAVGFVPNRLAGEVRCLVVGLRSESAELLLPRFVWETQRGSLRRFIIPQLMGRDRDYDKAAGGAYIIGRCMRNPSLRMTQIVALV